MSGTIGTAPRSSVGTRTADADMERSTARRRGSMPRKAGEGNRSEDDAASIGEIEGNCRSMESRVRVMEVRRMSAPKWIPQA